MLPVDPRLLDPRLYIRAMDDLHTLSTVAVRALDDLHRIAVAVERIDEVEETLAEAVGAVRALAGIEQRAVDLLAALDRVGSIEDRVGDLVALAEDVRGNLPHVRELLVSIEILGTAASTLASTTEPLQGAVERLGRITDRLPGARRAAKPPAKPKPRGTS